jgi:aminoglycoside/choline kinase family phosphotransferase
MIEHLDRIEKLGFTVILNWNKYFDIIYEIGDEISQSSSLHYPTDIRILSCSYTPFCGPTFEDIIETTCDFFYEWYNKNLEKIKDYDLNNSESNFDKLMDSAIGDITKKVYRDFNIDNILD